MNLALLEGLLVSNCGMLFPEELEAKLAFQPDRPVAIGVSGGRLRIAFMHPDIVRFFGLAWQMPSSAGDAAGDELSTFTRWIRNIARALISFGATTT
jgi:hypothetical protein